MRFKTLNQRVFRSLNCLFLLIINFIICTYNLISLLIVSIIETLLAVNLVAIMSGLQIPQRLFLYNLWQLSIYYVDYNNHRDDCCECNSNECKYFTELFEYQ